MLESVAAHSGEHLDLESYLDDFDQHFLAPPGHDVYKIERQQHFRQPESASWRAFSEGRWQDALRLLEENRPALEKQFTEIARAGVTVRRVRVVEWPLEPYLQWELHSLHLRAQCGEQIRVVAPDAIAAFEGDGPVPEVVTLGGDVAYVIRYTDAGILDGGLRISEPAVVTGCAADSASLFEAGEDIDPFFNREIAPLPPPRAR